MANDTPSTRLHEHGVVLLKNVFPHDLLHRLKDAATRCFDSIAAGAPPAERYRFSRPAHSLLLTALLDFGCEEDDLLAPLSIAGLEGIFCEAMGLGWRPDLDHSWLRKKFAPANAPASCHLQNWHQDGALGARFPLQPGPAIPITNLLTCWIPLEACGIDSPGLEFIRRRQPALLHFTELQDAALRSRFAAEDFWTPPMDLGDGLIFLNDALHRTHVDSQMKFDRLSIEYRIFPAL